jgi:hypothetical protein
MRTYISFMKGFVGCERKLLHMLTLLCFRSHIPTYSFALPCLTFGYANIPVCPESSNSSSFGWPSLTVLFFFLAFTHMKMLGANDDSLIIYGRMLV